MQASQDINVGGRASRTQYQFTLQDSDLDELDHYGRPILLRALQGIPLLRDVATDQQIAGPTLRLDINRDAGIAPGRRHAGDRRHALRCVRTAQDRAILYAAKQLLGVILEVDPQFQLDPNSLDLIHVPSTSGGRCL